MTRTRDDATANGPPTGWSPSLEPSTATGSYRPPRSLRVHRIDGSTEVLALDPDLDYRFGRSPENTVAFENDDTVSRTHGQLSCDGEGIWRYSDQRSRNGSFVVTGPDLERRKLSVEGLLKPYEHVRVGAGEVILFAKGRSRVELLEEPARPGAASRTRWVSEAGRRLEAQLAKAARNDLTVFLLGPSGAGKTFVAQQIHASSRRAKATFLPINCGRLPRDTTALHSELLGHVGGAFTGALATRVGSLATAHGGTVFLDEVESLSLEGQAFLLDVVERSGPLRPLGGSPHGPALQLDLRFISASKVPLAESGLRHDLCERLSALSIEIPALEERRADIPMLVSNLMKELRWPSEVTPRIEAGAMKLLSARDYRGQIRELRDALSVVGHDAVASLEDLGLAPSKAVITAAALESYFEGRTRVHERRKTTIIPAQVSPPLPAEPPRKRPDDITREEIEAALRESRGNQTHAAHALGMSLNTIKAKMRRLGLRREDFLTRS